MGSRTKRIDARFRRSLTAGNRLLLGAMALTVSVAAATAESDARDPVLAVVDTLFDGMRDKDPELLRSVFAPGTLVGDSDVETFVSNVLAATAHLDEVTFDETVLVDGDLAMAWTPYNIFVDGTFHHCGVDLFVMKRQDGAWKITALEDTRRTEGCEPERRD